LLFQYLQRSSSSKRKCRIGTGAGSFYILECVLDFIRGFDPWPASLLYTIRGNLYPLHFRAAFFTFLHGEAHQELSHEKACAKSEVLGSLRFRNIYAQKQSDQGHNSFSAFISH